MVDDSERRGNCRTNNVLQQHDDNNLPTDNDNIPHEENDVEENVNDIPYQDEGISK